MATTMAEPVLTGYADHLVVQPGQEIRFMVHAEGAGEAEVQLVRLVHGDENPDGPGFIERSVAGPIDGVHSVGSQRTQQGNFVAIIDAMGCLHQDGAFTMWSFIWPTTPAKGKQGILTRWLESARCGYGLGIDDAGQLAFWLGDGTAVEVVDSGVSLRPRQWYFAAAVFDPEGGVLTVLQEPVRNRYGNLVSSIAPLELAGRGSGRVDVQAADAGVQFLWAGYHDETEEQERWVTGLFNGKIDRSGVIGRALTEAELLGLAAEPEMPDGAVAHWDTTAGYTHKGIGDELFDRGPNTLHGMGYNRPVRAVTGYNWSGRDDCFRLAPAQYGGVWFHDDAIIDCGWKPTLAMTVPEIESGVYAARLRSGTAEDHITFFVRPRRPTAPIAMLMPTCTYLAYANERLGVSIPAGQIVNCHPPIFHDSDLELAGRPEYGLSTYDQHSDGGGVCYSSRLRPVLNMRPRYRMAPTVVPWGFPADLSIVGWLELKGYDYDVITDEDLHREGVDCLTPYQVVLNGTHAEYYTERMLDGTEDYLEQGGRLMYLSGNGYYWVSAFREGDPTCMEVRKLESGSRAWQALPGEHYMASNGERSGIWRNRGRPPQKLVGTGFSAEGFDESKHYRRMPAGYDEEVAWIFAGVEGEIIGDFGLGLGGAAGIELDRYDLALGTPPHTRILASSEGHADSYQLVVEEILFNYPGHGGTQHHHVRADMTYFTTPNDGAVWSASSIAWGQALPWNGCDNNVSRITANVLAAFMREGQLPGTRP